MQKVSHMDNVVEKVAKVHELDDAIKAAIEQESAAIIAFSTDEKRTVKRGGKPVEISNKEIMEEIRVTQRLDGEAGTILKEVSPDTYKALENTSKRSGEMDAYLQETFGFSFRHMGIADYMKLTEAIIEASLQKHGIIESNDGKKN